MIYHCTDKKEGGMRLNNDMVGEEIVRIFKTEF